MTVRVLRAEDVEMACPMQEAIRAVRAGFIALSAGRATVPLRLSVPIAEAGVALTMPASLAGSSSYAVKIVSVAPANPAARRPLVTATVLLIDASTGELLALVDGTSLTALRTGAAGGVAAEALSRPGSDRAALFGAGAQARTQLRALAAVRPIREVRLVTRDPAHARAFEEWASAQPDLERVSVRSAAPAQAIAEADVVVTATTSRTPVFAGVDLAAGVHITAVGSFTPEMRELDEETVRGARIVVDQRSGALAEAGELRGLTPGDVVELGEVLAGSAPGRESEAQRTIFKSVGNAVQDLVVAAHAFERARELGIGQVITFP